MEVRLVGEEVPRGDMTEGVALLELRDEQLDIRAVVVEAPEIQRVRRQISDQDLIMGAAQFEAGPALFETVPPISRRSASRWRRAPLWMPPPGAPSSPSHRRLIGPRPASLNPSTGLDGQFHRVVSGFMAVVQAHLLSETAIVQRFIKVRRRGVC
jgi:hypothetical protein